MLRKVTPLTLLAFTLSFLAFYCAPNPILNDTDIGWHIMAGDAIRGAGRVPIRDTWSYAGSTQIWYNMSWLWDVLLSVVHGAAGVKGLYLFGLALPASLVALLLASLRARGITNINALVATGFITSFALLEFTQARPQVAGLFLALGFHHILHKSRTQSQTKILFFLPLLMALWANIHGSFMAGFIVLGAYGLEALFSKNREWFARLLLVGVLCVLALCINPYGVDIITAVMRTLDSITTYYIREWQPFVFGRVIGVSLFVLVFVLAGNIRAKQVPVADKILAVAWLLATLYSERNIGLLAVLAAPYIAANLPRIERKDMAWLHDIRHSLKAFACVLIVLVAAVVALPYVGETHYRIASEQSITTALAYIKKHHPNARVLNDYNMGGQVIYETRGTLPVFVDGRAGTVYSEDILQEAIAFLLLQKDWQHIVKKYAVDVIFVLNNHSFALAYENGEYRDGWKQVYRDNVASVYVKKR